MVAGGPITFTNGALTAILNGTLVSGDTYKCALFLSTSDLAVTETTYAGLTNEHANAYGYTTGGISVAIALSGTTTVKVDVTTDPVWTASGGSIVAKWAVVYEVGGLILCYWLLDSTAADVTVTTGNTLTVAAPAEGLYTLTKAA
jgi:hypothetical protein